ncbi:hypothetical protein EXE25_18485 [Acinetobacter bouvetii]|uniref:Transcriptional regulator SutA RNAP-binding domain-containing protein n=1 Tax=Acinetobacter bouvetii TaxID=202951 RepID=A0A4Q7ALE8_9GAMM|nr:hypothetical protein [Acinetobacter bouvetii]RZG63798.1 hypothetical protein EXE25_18485 [Acinetobacter bouvetii]
MNEILQQRIESVQAGKNITHAQTAAKRNLRKELETEMEKFLARGGEIKQAETQTYRAKHGTNTQYVKHSCRCEVCTAWALKKGVVKTTQLKGDAA